MKWQLCSAILGASTDYSAMNYMEKYNGIKNDRPENCGKEYVK